MNIDHDLLFFDFTPAYAEDPGAAVHALQALLLDQAACRARIAFLRSLGELAGEALPEHDPGRSRGDFAAEIRTILEAGIAPALEQGRLDSDRLAALTRDPEGLGQLHRALVVDEEPREVDHPPAPAAAASQPARP